MTDIAAEVEKAIHGARAQMLQALVMDTLSRAWSFNKNPDGEPVILLVPTLSAMASVVVGLISSQPDPETWTARFFDEIRRQLPAGMKWADDNVKPTPETKNFLDGLKSPE